MRHLWTAWRNWSYITVSRRWTARTWQLCLSVKTMLLTGFIICNLSWFLMFSIWVYYYMCLFRQCPYQLEVPHTDIKKHGLSHCLYSWSTSPRCWRDIDIVLTTGLAEALVPGGWLHESFLLDMTLDPVLIFLCLGAGAGVLTLLFDSCLSIGIIDLRLFIIFFSSMLSKTFKNL